MLYDQACPWHVFVEKHRSTLRVRDYLLCSFEGAERIEKRGDACFLQTWIVSNACVTSSVCVVKVCVRTDAGDDKECRPERSIACRASGTRGMHSTRAEQHDRRWGLSFSSAEPRYPRQQADKGIPLSATWRTRDSATYLRPVSRSPLPVNIKNADECIQLYPAALKARHACE